MQALVFLQALVAVFLVLLVEVNAWYRRHLASLTPEERKAEEEEINQEMGRW